MKRWLAYLLILLFSMQALPVRELGKAMLKKAATEQPAGDEDTDLSKEDSAKGKSEAAKYLSSNTPFILIQSVLDTKVSDQLHGHSLIPASHYFEVPTPPPNC